MGINVFVRGYKWPEGRVNFHDMLEIFARSRINLNLNPPMSSISFKSIAQIFFRRRRNLIVPDFLHLHANLRSYFQKKIPQIKARPFEITGSDGLCITGEADDTESYFVPGKEIIIYKDTKDLIEKIKYYLEREDERKEIQRGGYRRSLRDHSYVVRLNEIFKELDLNES